MNSHIRPLPAAQTLRGGYQSVEEGRLECIQVQDVFNLLVQTLQILLLIPLRLPANSRPVDGNKITTMSFIRATYLKRQEVELTWRPP
jgi:hypothetical protein